MKLPLLVSLVALSAASVAYAPRTARAGEFDSNIAGVQVNTNGTAVIWGTYYGFRNDPDPGAYVQFRSITGQSSTIDATKNGVHVACTVPSSMTAAFNQLQLSRGYFYVGISTTGICNQIQISSSSSYNTP